jgi:hypothetical protein
MARGTYWSLSPFATWLRNKYGMPAIGKGREAARTSEGWDEFDQQSKEVAPPFIYWLINDGLNKAQNFFCWPKDKYRDLGHYLRNRFVTQTHLAPTKLKKGEWHETEERMLHAMFELLVDFVEVEQAWHDIAWGEKEDHPPAYWKRALKGQFKPFRSAALGIKHFEWARSLTGDWEGHKGELTGQAIAAEEIMHLYAWWTVTRPNRRDPWEYYIKLTTDEEGNRVRRRKMSRQMKEAAEKGFDEVHRLEAAYEKEDEEKLIRLIKIRKALWT